LTTPPSFRYEIETTNDIISEIGRIYGYDSIADKSTFEYHISDKQKDFILSETIIFLKDFFSRQINETISFPFITAKEAEMFQDKNIVENICKLENPIHKEFNTMRNSLIPELLKKIKNNIANFKIKELQLFEVGKIFYSPVQQEEHLTAVILSEKNEEYILSYIKNQLSRLTKETLNTDAIFKKQQLEYAHPNKSVRLEILEQTIATFGELHPGILNEYEINQKIWFFDISIKSLIDAITIDTIKKDKGYISSEEKSFYKREFAIIVNDKIDCELFYNLIKTTPNILDVEILDIYKSIDLGEDKKSIAFLIYISKNESEQTQISETEYINNIFKQAIEICTINGAILRDSIK
jgi:phenylalanyl-tRNA synthetase beta chain